MKKTAQTTKIYYGQVQRINSAVKLVEVIRTLISQTTILANAFFLQIAFKTLSKVRERINLGVLRSL